MEELKQLIELVLKLPNTALWILAGYLLYKLSVIGSIYGIIRLAIEKVYSIYHAKLTAPKKVVYSWKEGIEPISEEVKSSIVNSLIRLKAHATTSAYSDYVHRDYANALENIVNNYISQLPLKK